MAKARRLGNFTETNEKVEFTFYGWDGTGYNASNLDKDEWVKEWKKNGGVQAAYDWECAKRIKAEKAAKGAEGEKTNMAKALIKKADQFNDEEMNRMAIAIIGERDYLVYKLENQLKLTEDDKKRILANLK